MERVSVTITTDTPIRIKVTRDAGGEGACRLLSAVKGKEEAMPDKDRKPCQAAKADV